MKPAGTDPAPATGGRGLVRHAVLRFTAWSVLTFTVLVGAAIVIGDHIAKGAALDDARLRGATFSGTVAGPLVDSRVRDGDSDAVRQLERVMRGRMSDGSLRHVKLWSQDGTVIWSDEQSLVGRRFQLEEEVRALFGTTAVRAELSDLTKAENIQERSEGELLEVYAGAKDAEKQPFVFEAYLTTARMRAYERTLVVDILSVAIGGLLLFQIAVLPLATSLARRVEKVEAERSRMMRHHLLVTVQERRRLAKDLHDGVIQDLAGISFALPVVKDHVPATADAAPAREAIDRALTLLRTDVASLRTMLTEIYPPDLDNHGGFLRAVNDLAQSVRERGTEIEVLVPDEPQETVDTTRLAYSVIREGLRNVLKHARASHARVEMTRHGRLVRVTVSDDGVGVRPDMPVADGHLGLALLEDSVTDFGGTLTVRAAPGGGTVLEAEFPPIKLPP